MIDPLTIHVLLAAAGGDVAAGAAGAEGASVAVESVWDFVVKGGVMMIPLGICSLVAFTVFVERLVSLRRSRITPSGFLPALKSAVNGGDAAGIKAGLDYCEKDGSPMARVFAAGIRKLGGPLEIVERHIQETGQREVLRLRKYLRVLAVIASIAPLMGLLGTIFGMISAFQTVATSADALGKTELLAEGIYQAMITTAAGLVVAIPALIAFHYLTAKIQTLVMDIDMASVEFLEDLDARTHQIHHEASTTAVPTVEVTTSTNGVLPAASAASASSESPAEVVAERE